MPGVTAPGVSPSTALLPATSSPLAEVTPVPPGATPEGVDRIARTSAPITTRPPAKPTATPDPAVWRFEGAVVEEDGEPLEGVCVIIGPHGCQRGSIRTDPDGRYFIDLPQMSTVLYDIYFAKEGYEVVWHQVRPSGPEVFNVMLKRG